MSILHSYNFNRHHFFSINATIILQWYWIVRREKKQAIWVLYVDRKLPFFVANQFVTSSWRKRTQNSQIIRRVKIIKAAHYQTSTSIPIIADQH
ncbi:MAG: hypothetical protein WCJ56_12130 [bacterium]